MSVPLVVCYTTEQALQILKNKGVNSVEIIKIRAEKELKEYFTEERVICQRERNGRVQLIVC